MRPWWTLALLLGCSGDDGTAAGGDGDDYVINLKPLVPLDQKGLLADLTSLELTLQSRLGETETVTLTGDTSSGGYAQATALPALDESTLTLVGKVGATTVAFGRTAPITASTGEQDVSVLISELDRFGLLGGVDKGSFFGQILALGDGRFLVMGGSTRATSNNSGTDGVFSFDVSDPSSDLRLAEWPHNLPPLSDKNDGRSAFTATLLTGNSDDQGKVLVAGGAADFFSSGDVAETLTIWDPATGDAEVLEGRKGVLPEPFAHHTAVEDPAGNVVFVGGITNGTGSLIYFTVNVAVYDPSSREIVASHYGSDLLALGAERDAAFFHASARLGSEGVLTCGGLSIDSSTSSTVSRDCFLVNLGGELEAVDPLPIPLMEHRMVTLSNGDVLVIGGFTTELDENVDDAEVISSSPYVFRYDGKSWTEVEDAPTLLNPRASHGVALMAGDKVMVVGGIYEANNAFFDFDGAIACAEVFDAIAEKSVAVDGCTESNDSATLPQRTALPMVASDPEYGVLLVGGVGADDSVLDQALFYVPSSVLEADQ